MNVEHRNEDKCSQCEKKSSFLDFYFKVTSSNHGKDVMIVESLTIAKVYLVFLNNRGVFDSILLMLMVMILYHHSDSACDGLIAVVEVILRLDFEGKNEKKKTTNRQQQNQLIELEKNVFCYFSQGRNVAAKYGIFFVDVFIFILNNLL
eukprot:GDKJ01007274.1.p1 GENE.GDKJ01007274.1~~GDKJ01007274.1.p1  ORF type:complete len:149 (+),score=25.58 GDKJ01007274.1:1100-1546(+)